MKQVYYHYTLWEDFQAHMYDEDKEGREERVCLAVELLTDCKKLYKYMKEVSQKWKYASEQNFTNKSINHQAFLGQSACCLYAGIHEDETREAWGRLTNEQRYKANKVADRVFTEWCNEYERMINGNYQLSLLDLEGEYEEKNRH